VRKRTAALVLTTALVALWAPAGFVASSKKDLPRFHQVNAIVFRGGQPQGGGFRQLQKMGIRTVVNLRVEDDERATVEGLGMKYVHIPIAMPLLTRPFKQIPEADIEGFLRVLQNPENQPVFVHCRRGADRTGAMVGFYRIALDKWDPEEAYSEARKFGMRWWYRAFKSQLLEFETATAKPPP